MKSGSSWSGPVVAVAIIILLVLPASIGAQQRGLDGREKYCCSTLSTKTGFHQLVGFSSIAINSN